METSSWASGSISPSGQHTRTDWYIGKAERVWSTKRVLWEGGEIVKLHSLCPHLLPFFPSPLCVGHKHPVHGGV